MKKVFKLKECGAASKYRGCGHGWVVLDDSHSKVIDFDYSDDFETTINDQNIDMTPKAGHKIGKNKFIANFSCWEAVLF